MSKLGNLWAKVSEQPYHPSSPDYIPLDGFVLRLMLERAESIALGLIAKLWLSTE
jgi:hypothetical protein